jgi:hypothetical protein
MSGQDHLSADQFSYYRGLHLGGMVDPNDDASIVGKLKTRNPKEFDVPPEKFRGYPLYGSHWSTDEDVSRQFATNTHPNTGKKSGYANRDPHQPVYGVVVEAKSPVPPKHKEWESGYGEREVNFPHRDHVTEVIAHVHQLNPPPEGGDGKMNNAIKRRNQTHVRSFPIPESHWRNA